MGKTLTTMEEVQISTCVLLLCLPFTLGLNDTVKVTRHFQNIYPGCKSSPSDPDMSVPECDSGAFANRALEYSNISINTEQLGDCFVGVSSDIKILSGLETFAEFDGPSSQKASFDCRDSVCNCEIHLQGPPGTFFFISAQRFSKGTSELDIRITGGSTPQEFDFRDVKSTNTILNEVKLGLTYAGTVLGAISFSFRFLAVPDCVRQLHVQCNSSARGMIETRGWRKGEKYLLDTESCVTLHVPENHVTMISLISLDVELKDDGKDCYDYLMFYKTANCTGHHEKKICQPRALMPTVIKDARVLSFLFVSDEVMVRTGFRLLYSFHNATEEPRQLSDGKWECNVSYFNSFRQHFMCVPESFCSDKSDKVTCPEVGLCGSNLLTLDGSCYRAFDPSGQTNWNKASETCDSYKGDLAVLNRPSELKSVNEYVKTAQLTKPIFIGLRIASYQNTWLWADDTLAVYLPIVFHKVQTPYCAALNHSNITVVNCNEKMDAAFLCETDYTPDVINDTVIPLATPSGWDSEMMTTCRHGQVTHNFLACDVSTNCSAWDQEESSACADEFSPPVPFYTCRNQLERIPYSLVCDFRSDCCDDSDEDFCEFPACDSGTHYVCTGSKQCIDRDLLCNKRRDCVDETDELRCQDSVTSSKTWSHVIEPPARVDFTGEGDFTVVPLATSRCPETHYQCPGGGYCLPIYTRCNKFYDCPGKEDEMDCDHYTCPGFYRCRGSKVCLHKQHLCDNVNHCPENDDELMCNFTCPDTCHCYGHAFVCTGAFLTDNYTELRYVDASGTGMTPGDFVHNSKLIHLSLKKCGIAMLSHLNFPNLQILDLSYNDIRELESSDFRSLTNLVHISLSYNSLMSVDSFLYTDFNLSYVKYVYLSGIPVPYPTDTFFDTFPSVQHLNMSNCGVKKVTERGFQSLINLRELDLRGCPMETFYSGVFDGLNYLKSVYSDNYRLCCPADLPDGMQSEGCHAPTDEISSCDALLRRDVFRVFLALYAILALTGNLGSFVYRVCIDKTAANLGYEVFVTHLSAADFLMGVYLAIIGIADRVYFGNYRWNDKAWKHSVACKLAGFLSLVSSEVSAYLICLITLERFLVIGFPHRNLRFRRLSAHVASVAVWLVGLILALVPLLPVTSHWDFYSQSGICIPLPVTRNKFDGSDYAFGVMIVVNFVLFLFIAVGQLLIYWSIHVNTVSSKDSGRKTRETAIARRLLAVVMTDFICWFPIGVLGMMARSGIPISGEISVILAIFVLPFNSALNPFLYTVNIIVERHRKASKARRSQSERTSQNKTNVFDVVSGSRASVCNYSEEEAFQLFQKLVEKGLLTSEQIRHHIWDIYEG